MLHSVGVERLEHEAVLEERRGRRVSVDWHQVNESQFRVGHTQHAVSKEPRPTRGAEYNTAEHRTGMCTQRTSRQWSSTVHSLP